MYSIRAENKAERRVTKAASTLNKLLLRLGLDRNYISVKTEISCQLKGILKDPFPKSGPLFTESVFAWNNYLYNYLA